MFVNACSGWSELYKTAPPDLHSPVVTLQTYSGTLSCPATRSTNPKNLCSSLLSTVMIGLRELMSSDNWSHLAPAALPASVAHVGPLTIV